MSILTTVLSFFVIPKCVIFYLFLSENVNSVHRILSSRIFRNLAIFNLQLDLVSLDLQASTCCKLLDLQLQESRPKTVQSFFSNPVYPVLPIQSCLFTRNLLKTVLQTLTSYYSEICLPNMY